MASEPAIYDLVFERRSRARPRSEDRRHFQCCDPQRPRGCGRGVFHHMFGGTWGKQEIGFSVHRKLIEEKPDLVQRIVASHAEAIARVSEPDARHELEAKGSRLPVPVLAMTEKQFLKVDYRTNLADVATIARRMHAAGWTNRDIAGEIEKNVRFRFLEKATGKSKAELTQW